MVSRYIALDIGEVCIDLNEKAALNYFGFTASSLMELPLPLIQALDLYERGKLDEVRLFETIRPFLPRPMADDEIKFGWNLVLGAEKKGIAKLIAEGIQMGYRFAFFSDTSPAHFLKCVADLSFAHLVDGRITSYETGAKKPEDPMFEAFEYAYGIPAFYFDDKAVNVEAAKRNHGWNGHVFSDPDQALDILRAFRLTQIAEPLEGDDDYDN